MTGDRLAGGDGSRADRGIAEILGDPFFEPERRARVARLHQVVNELVQRSFVGAAPTVIVVDEHRSAFALRDEDAAGVRVAPFQEQVEIRPALVSAGEEDDARRTRRGRAECGVDLRQRRRERLQLRGHSARPFLVGAADEDEMFRARQEPVLIGSGEGDRLVDLARRGVRRGSEEECDQEETAHRSGH